MLTTGDVAAVMACYDLGAVTRVFPVAHGGVNATTVVETAQGRFVLRRTQRRLGAASLAYRHTFMAHLRSQGVPAPRLMTTRSGETVVTRDGRFYELQAYIAGSDVDPAEPEQLASVGATLAQYHRAVQHYPPPPGSAESQGRYDPQRLLGLSETILERDLLGELHSALAAYDHIGARLRSTLTAATYAALPHLVIHGDVHAGNLIVADDAVVGLIDYDQIAWDARLVDLADALVAFATQPTPDPAAPWGVFRGPLDIDQSASLLAAYQQVAPLSARELYLLPVMIETLWLAGELGRVIATPEGAPDYHLAVLAQGQTLTAWMAAQQPRVLAAWGTPERAHSNPWTRTSS